MLRSAIFIVATALATAVHAAPLASAPPFEISSLSIQKVMGGNVTFSFTVRDPDPLTGTNDTCEGVWASASKGFPTESYKPCSANSTFAWHMEDFKTIKDFTLGIEHSYEDPAIGDPPYDWITNFGRVALSEKNAPCSVEDKTTTCSQSDNVLQAPIYATIAKR